jgi:predicted transcriptional regulator
MIFSITLVRGIYEILEFLNNKKENYAHLYKETGISHETLQTALKFLVIKKLIEKEDKGHKKSFYRISEKGRTYLLYMKKLKELEN